MRKFLADPRLHNEEAQFVVSRKHLDFGHVVRPFCGVSGLLMVRLRELFVAAGCIAGGKPIGQRHQLSKGIFEGAGSHFELAYSHKGTPAAKTAGT